MLTAVNNDLTALNGGLDIWMRLLQLILIVAIVGTLVAIWNAYVVANAPGKHRLATIWAILIALAAAFLVWLCLDLRTADAHPELLTTWTGPARTREWERPARTLFGHPPG